MAGRPLKLLCAALALATMLPIGGCAGLPIGRHTYLFAGVGIVRVDRADTAIGVSSRSIGLAAGCRNITIGLQASYCAELPIGDVGIIERGSGPDQHLTVLRLHPRERTP